jgi:hypothetical protein
LKCAKALLFVSLFFPSILQAQFSDPLNRQKEGTEKLPDYLFPIAPGTPNTLAGTMGELRNTHFHSGIDIRTNNQVGAAVLAAQKGFVSRAVRSTWSYGNVLYITHPDGNTTLYAHLNEFKGKLGTHVRQEQYNRKTFEIDLRFGPNDFPVNQGDTIALSGNTGSSNGPHLHFDIRDKNMNALNPLHFGFEEVIDKTAPVVIKLALRTMSMDARVNGKFGRFEFSVYKVGSTYTFLKPILAHGTLGVELLAYDKMDNSRFQCGINSIEMKVDSQRVFIQKIDGINMPITRGILAHFDYKTLKTSGFRFNKLYIDEGNPLPYYEGTVNRGFISVTEKDVPVAVSLFDAYGNKAKLAFTLKHDAVTATVPTFSHGAKPLGYTLMENVLQVTGKVCTDSTAKVFMADGSISAKPAYTSATSRAFLFDLRRGIPDSVQSCGETVRITFHDMVPSARAYTYFGKNVAVHFPDSALFDTLYLSVRKNLNRKAESIYLGDSAVPLMRDVKVEWLPEELYNSKYGVYRVNSWGGFTNMAGQWQGNKISFSTREFGEFVLLPDSLPPAITKIALNQTYARFKITDNLSGIFSFEANINGHWLLMNFEHKTGILFSEKLDRKMLLKGDFELKVTDYAGNEKIFKQKIL